MLCRLRAHVLTSSARRRQLVHAGARSRASTSSSVRATSPWAFVSWLGRAGGNRHARRRAKRRRLPFGEPRSLRHGLGWAFARARLLDSCARAKEASEALRPKVGSGRRIVRFRANSAGARPFDRIRPDVRRLAISAESGSPSTNKLLGPGQNSTRESQRRRVLCCIPVERAQTGKCRNIETSSNITIRGGRRNRCRRGTAGVFEAAPPSGDLCRNVPEVCPEPGPLLVLSAELGLSGPKLGK